MRTLSCYLDTRLIINALGLHLPQETKTCATEFLEMLRNSGVKLFCFQHNYEEIYNVLCAYKKNISNGINKKSNNTLETFGRLKSMKYYTVLN